MMNEESPSQTHVWLRRYFGDLPLAELNEVAAHLRHEEISSGGLLYRHGDAGDCMHFVLTGRLEVRLRDEYGNALPVTHLSGGDLVGELSVLTGNRRAADVVAIRDSTVARLDRQDYEEIIRDLPQVGFNIARYALDRLVSGTKRFTPRVTNIAIVPLHPGVSPAEFGRRLELALMQFGKTLYLDSQTVRELLPRPRGGQTDEFQLQMVLDQAEKTRRFVIYQADAEATDWTRKCVRQADRVLLLADETRAPAITPIEEALFGKSAGAILAEKELILLRSSRRTTPSGTATWLAPRQVERHSNVALEDNDDIARLARLLSGNAVTLVLGGGGARGFAHIGIIRAIHEAKIPIDAVGGTSIGAIIGGLVALGWDDERILNTCKRGFVDDRPLDDYTFPLFALLQGEKLGRTIRHYTGDVDIVDLWLPYFCVSTNLSRSRLEAHHSGTLWRALKASATLPGILPPVIKNGELHVDGGVLDNLPVGAMKQFIGGSTIAVRATGTREFTVPFDSFPTPLQYLRSRLSGRANHANLPSMIKLLVSATTLGSFRGAGELQDKTDLFLQPPVQAFDLLDWKAIYKLVDIGYEYAQKQLSNWIEANRDTRSRDGLGYRSFAQN